MTHMFSKGLLSTPERAAKVLGATRLRLYFQVKLQKWHLTGASVNGSESNKWIRIKHRGRGTLFQVTGSENYDLLGVIR